ncbi:hypothetical protein R3P38DRAFT_2809105 [Favolaschia claudopus]|uniref:Uncharacterized protein n=1 Tax=Favolaschia claudopus TaxID=2862362 RepID=A0AAV9ZDD9_9AGAR
MSRSAFRWEWRTASRSAAQPTARQRDRVAARRGQVNAKHEKKHSEKEILAVCCRRLDGIIRIKKRRGRDHKGSPASTARSILLIRRTPKPTKDSGHMGGFLEKPGFPID